MPIKKRFLKTYNDSKIMKHETLSIERDNAKILINAIIREFHPAFEYTSKSGNVKILGLEEYDLWRTNSTMAATLIFDFEDTNLCNINIVVTGGKVGILQLSWGAENSLLKKIMRFFQKHGYEKPWKEV